MNPPGLCGTLRDSDTATRLQNELRADPAILRTAAQHHGACVGLFAAVGTPGRIRVGDPVMQVTGLALPRAR